MVKIAEIPSQNPWWSQVEDFPQYDKSLSLAQPIFFERKEIEEIIPFKPDLSYLFRLYLVIGRMPDVINHYFSNRFLDQVDKIENHISEIPMRGVAGYLAKFQ